MLSTLALLAALVVVLYSGAVIWRATRRVLALGHLKEISVSRQWLLQHQGTDES